MTVKKAVIVAVEEEDPLEMAKKLSKMEVSTVVSTVIVGDRPSSATTTVVSTLVDKASVCHAVVDQEAVRVVAQAVLVLLETESAAMVVLTVMVDSVVKVVVAEVVVVAVIAMEATAMAATVMVVAEAVATISVVAWVVALANESVNELRV